MHDLHLGATNISVVSLGNSLVGRFLVLEVNVSVTETFSVLLSNSARKNSSVHREGIMKEEIVNRLWQVLDKDVSNAGLSHSRVTLRPHDAARFSVDLLVVQVVERSVGILHIVEVHISVSQRTTSGNITANSHRCDATAS